MPTSLPGKCKKIIAELDSQGRWISTFAGEPLYGQPKFKTGEQYIHSGVFSQNVETLSAFLEGAAVAGSPQEARRGTIR